MKSFALDDKGDLLIENGKIQMVYGNDLTRQKIKTVWTTQKGEWFLDWEQGINRKEILGNRNIENDVIKAELQNGVLQVSEQLSVNELETDFDKQTRKLRVHCVVTDGENGGAVEISDSWG